LAAAVALAWIVVISGIYLKADRLEVWYYLLPLAGFSLLVGAVAGGLVASVRSGMLAARVVAFLGLLLLVAMVGWQARYSPLMHRYDEWRRATTASNAFLTELKTRIEAAPNGSVVESPPMPLRVPFDEKRPCIRGAHVLNDYSVQAWVELVFPARKIQVRWPKRGAKAAPDEVLVQLRPKLAGF
jgi:hypothetical protein